MRFTLHGHTADVIVGADSESPGTIFAAITDGFTTMMCDDPAEAGDRFSFAVHAKSREALLFDYFDQFIYRRDVYGVSPTAREATVWPEDGEWVVEASTRGVPFADVDVRDVKAVTYSEM